MAKVSSSKSDSFSKGHSRETPLWLRALYAIVSLCCLGLALVYGVVAFKSGANPTTPLFIVLIIGLALIHWILVLRQRDDFKKLRAGLNNDVARGLEGVERHATDLLASKVDVLAKRTDVLEAIAEVYEMAANRARENKECGDGKPETIILFGASSIQPRAGEPINSSETEETPSERLDKARTKAERENVRFDRYVRLFDDKNFLGRSPEIRNAYLVWLGGQISLLTRSPLHTLYNARRAPRWKAIRSSVASETSFVDILGDGESGFVIRGDQFAKSQRRNSREYINDTTGGREPILGIFRQQNVDDLKKHFEEMSQLNDAAEG